MRQKHISIGHPILVDSESSLFLSRVSGLQQPDVKNNGGGSGGGVGPYPDSAAVMRNLLANEGLVPCTYSCDESDDPFDDSNESINTEKDPTLDSDVSSVYSASRSFNSSNAYTTSTLSRFSLLSDLERKLFRKKLIEKQNCIRELYFTEWQFSQDLAVVVRIYMCSSASTRLFPCEIETLFSNITEIFEISLNLLEILRAHIPKRVLEGDGYVNVEDIKAESNMHIGHALSLAINSTFYSIYECYIHNNERQMRLYSEIVRPEPLPTRPISKLAKFKSKFRNHRQDSATKLYDQSREELLMNGNMDHTITMNWLDKCNKRAEGLTSSQTLDLLLFKPVQRLAKYPLFLKTLLECTEPEHEDYENIEKSYNRVTRFIQFINARL